MLSEDAIVCLSITPWETVLPSTGHYLMRELARANRVLFVDRPMTWKDVWTMRGDPEARGRWLRTLGLAPRLRRVPDPARDLWVLTPPPMAPNGLFDPLYDLAMAPCLRAVRQEIRQAMRALGMRHPILHINFELPTGARLAGTLGERLVIYHCFDEVAGEPHLARHGLRLETELLARADLVLTTSPELQRSRSLRHAHCHYLPNGVDAAHYATAQLDATRIPPELARLPHPVIGFLGHLEARLDYALLAAVARAFPHGSLALVGPVHPQWRGAVHELAKLPNVHLLGPRPASLGPALLKGMDVALIPFVASAQTRAIYPLKLHEYLAAGRPVVLTPFAELADAQGVVEVAAGPEAFVAAIARALATDTPQARHSRLEVARRHDWGVRSAAYGELVTAMLDARGSRALEGTA